MSDGMRPELRLPITDDDSEVIGEDFTKGFVPRPAAVELCVPGFAAAHLCVLIDVEALGLFERFFDQMTVLVRDEVASHRRHDRDALAAYNDRAVAALDRILAVS